MRGNLNPIALQLGAEGSIPACAGEPRLEWQMVDWLGVYPRVCGGTVEVKRPIDGDNGLSPRVRGNQAVPLFVYRHDGSIPACAGEPPAERPETPSCAVYPRVCGGTFYAHYDGQGGAGLSPRVRGNQQRMTRDAYDGHSIPACAGEPGCRGCACRCWAVYPRVCGGTRGAGGEANMMAGLSPRVRGNRD